jgi:hypothetical protein
MASLSAEPILTPGRIIADGNYTQLNDNAAFP